MGAALAALWVVVGRFLGALLRFLPVFPAGVHHQGQLVQWSHRGHLPALQQVLRPAGRESSALPGEGERLGTPGLLGSALSLQLLGVCLLWGRILLELGPNSIPVAFPAAASGKHLIPWSRAWGSAHPPCQPREQQLLWYLEGASRKDGEGILQKHEVTGQRGNGL